MPRLPRLPHKKYERLLNQYNRTLLHACILEEQIMLLLKANSTKDEHIRRECEPHTELYRGFSKTLADELAAFRAAED